VVCWRALRVTFIVPFEIEHVRILTPCNVDYLPEVALAHSVRKKKDSKTYTLFEGWEARIVKNCERGLKNAAFLSPSESQFFTIRTGPAEPVNNLFLFFQVLKGKKKNTYGKNSRKRYCDRGQR